MIYKAYAQVDNDAPVRIEIGTPKTRAAKMIRARLKEDGWGRGYEKRVKSAVDGAYWGGFYITIDYLAECISKDKDTECWEGEHEPMREGTYCIQLYGAGRYGELEEWLAVSVERRPGARP